MVGMTALVSSLSLCVVSIWLPGSPFKRIPEETMIKPDTKDTNDRSTTDCSNPSFISVSVLVTGIILARYGLWVTDLSVNQVQQVQVEQHKRGVVGGVQSSLNNFFNMTKFLLVILLPNPNTFGILIILSFIFVSLGGVSITYYTLQRGKLSLNC